MAIIDLNSVKPKCYPLKNHFFKGDAYESWNDSLFPVDGSSSDA